MTKVSDKILSRVYLLFAGILLFSCAIMYQVVKLQFFEKEKWEQKASKKRVFLKKVVAVRGNILADDGSILATSQPFFRLSMDPTLINESDFDDFDGDLEELCINFATHFGNEEFDKNYFKEKIQRGIEKKDRHIYLLKRPVNYNEYKMVSQWPILNRSKFKGGLIETRLNNKRFYPFKNLARITRGTLKNDTLPEKGIEYSFNKELRGKDGQMLMQRVKGNREIPLEQLGKNEAVNGSDVLTTLNLEMQDITETALLRGVEKHKAKYGVAILMEVETGEIKAIANLTRTESGKYYEGYNYGVAELNEPGSTMKVATLMAALDDKKVKVTDSVDTGDKGFAMYYDKVMKDHVALGKLSIGGGLRQSSNLVMADVVTKNYANKPGEYIARLERFGLLNPVNSQLKGEPKPKIIRPGDKFWNGTTLPWLSIGYNIQVTPLQMLTFYNAIANDGKMVEPKFVREIKRNSHVEERFKTKVLNKQICKDKTLEILRELMEGVVERGTAKGIRSNDLKMAGKTGTTQKLVNGEYRKIYQTSFAGYFPADNPRYSCFVLIDEPSNGEYYGATVAAPVFREIADHVYSMDIELSRDFSKEPVVENAVRPMTKIVSQENAENVYRKLNINTPTEPESRWVRSVREGQAVDFQPVKVKPGYMPEVRGMSARDALNLLENQGLQVRLSGYGKVRKQSIPAGRKITQGRSVTLQLK